MNMKKRRGSPAARLGAALLSLALIFTLIPGVSMPVLAEDASGTPEVLETPAEAPETTTAPDDTPAAPDETPAATPSDQAPEMTGEETSGAQEEIETLPAEVPLDDLSLKAVTGISIKTLPSQVTYYAPTQVLDLTGLAVEIVNEDGIKEDLSAADYTVDPADGTPIGALGLGPQTVTVTYPKTGDDQQSATFDVTVEGGTPKSTANSAFTFSGAGTAYAAKYKVGTYSYKNVVVPDNYNSKQVTTISDKGFYNETAMMSLMMKTTITTIGKEAFLGCTNLTSIDLGTTNPNGVKSKVKTIGDRAFQGCTSLESIYLPAAVETIGQSAFVACTSLENIIVDPANTKFKDIDGVLFSKDGKTLLAYPAGRADDEYTVPEGTEYIGADAFRFQVDDTDTFTSPLTSVIFPSTLKKINARAFMYGGLEETTIFPGTEIDGTAFDNCPDLKTVHVAEGVTELPQKAFDAVYTGIDTLEKLTLPDSLEVIGESALQGYPLASIQLPEGLKVIGNNAFADSKLTSITLPDSLSINTLPAGIFKDCTELKSVHLPAVISGTEDAAFWNCSDLTVEYDAPRLLRSPLDCYEFILNNESSYDLGENGFYYTNRELQLGGTTVPAGSKLTPQTDGIAFTYTGDPESQIQPAITSVSASSGTDGDTYVFIEIIAEGIQAGDTVQLKAEPKPAGDTITGEGLAALGKGEKRGYFVAVKTLALTAGTVGDYNVFASLDGNSWVGSGGKAVKLDSIQVTKSPARAICAVGDNLDLTGLEVTAFYTDGQSKILAGNAYTTEPAGGSLLTVPGEQTVIVTYIEGGIKKTDTFAVTVKALDSIEVTSLPAKTIYAVGDTLDLTGLEITASYTDGSTEILNDGAYTTVPASGFEMAASGMQTVTVKYPKTDGPNQMSAAFGITVATPDSAFEFAEDPGGGSYIVKKYLGGYQDAVVPGTYHGKPVTAIGDEAFDKAVATVILPDSIISIGEKAFYNRSTLKSVDLGQGVKSIGQMAFQSCSALTAIELPASVETIGWNAFGFCKKLKDIKVNANNGNFKDIDGVLFSKDGKTLIYYSVAGRGAATYAIPEGTERIEEDAFRTDYQDTLISALKSVTYPSTLKEIADRAFYQASLEEVTVFKDIKYGAHVYELCKNLKTVTVEDGVTELGDWIFYGADNLEKLTLPGTLKVIGEGALYRYPLASIDFPASLVEIGTNAFCESKLTSITIPASVTKVGDRAFASNRDLTKVRFEKGTQIAAIDQQAFANCGSLTDIILPGSLKSLGTGVFKDCLNLTSIDLPEGLTTLGDYVFATTGIQTMAFPDSVTEIGSDTFYFCNALTSVTFPKNLEKLGQETFRYCRDNLVKVEFPETVKLDTLPAGTFWECFSLSKVHLPAAISGTDDAAFYGCLILAVEYDAPILRRSPLDCVGLILHDDSLYDLREDGIYSTNTEIAEQGGLIVWPVGTLLVPDDEYITFTYTGDPAKRIQPAITKVSVSASGGGARVEVEAQGIQAGDSIKIKAVHKTTGYEIKGNGAVALGKGERRGYFAAVKTLAFDVGTLEDYIVSASLDGNTWVNGSGKPVQLDYIRVTRSPAKTSYTAGDKLDLTGLEVKAFYNDKSSETLASGSCTTEPGDGATLSAAGKQTVIVRYTKNGIDKTASFDVTVNAKDNDGGSNSGGNVGGGGGSKTPSTGSNASPATNPAGESTGIPSNNPTGGDHFADMPSAPWAVEAVNFVTNRGLFTGTSANHFEPDAL